MKLLALTTIVLSAALALTLNAWAQTSIGYQSPVDAELTVRSISLLPVFDNLGGIYSRPIEKYLTQLLKRSHHFNYLSSNYAGPITTPDELEQNSGLVKKIFLNFSSDAFIAVSIAKGPLGVSVKMDLFLKSDKQLLVQVRRENIQLFSIAALKFQVKKMLRRLFQKLPYSGLILSRQGTRVTVNLGKLDGVKPGEILTVIQIVKITRHPKFHFMVSSVKSIIGQVRLLKVQSTLSFGRVINEIEPGAIEVDSKIAPFDYVKYPENNSLSNLQTPVGSLLMQPGAKSTYGKSPTAWVPTPEPTFGMVGVRLGVGKYTENVHLTSTSLDDSANIYPSIFLDGVLWLTPTWSAHAHIRQGIISTSNPVSGGTPSTLSHRLSYYDLLFGYNIRLAQSIEAPKLELLFGYANYSMYVDQSTPAGITSKTYSGPELGLSGWYPINPQSPYGVGANFYYMFNPSLHESPTSTGSSSNSATQFGIFLDKQLRVNLKARIELDFDLFASNFSAGATSSQEQDVFSGGLYYMF